MKSVLTMILAGGRGKRMDILCHERAKPTLPFAGKFRVIDFTLSNCLHSGSGDIAVLTDYQRSNMANYLKQWSAANNIKLHILEPESGSYKGTADAVYQNYEYLQNHSASTVLVLAADHVYKMDYRKMLDFHREVNADVTIGAVSVPIEQAHRFGIIKSNGRGKVIEFMEKPSLAKSKLASMGIYIFNKDILLSRLAEDAGNPSSPHDFGHAVVPEMVKKDQVYVYKFKDYWQDIGTVEAYYAANIELTRETPLYTLDSNWPIFTRNYDLPSPRVVGKGSVKNSLISPGCVIKGLVEDSVLSPGVVVEERTVVRNSVVMTRTVIGEQSVIEHSVLDEGVNIGKFCYVGFGRAPGDQGITVIGREVNVPAHTAIGHNCRILPHAGPGDFTTNAVPFGTVVSPLAKPVAEN